MKYCLSNQFLFLCLLFSPSLSKAQLIFDWAFGGGVVGNSDVGYIVQTDPEGNVYFAGEYGGLIDFDPGPGMIYLDNNMSDVDVFLAKYNNTGELVYAKSFQSELFETCTSIEIDQSNNLYLCGYFEGPTLVDNIAEFPPITCNGNTDIFIAKLDSMGNPLLLFNIGGLGMDYGELALDMEGNFIVTGTFQETVDFDPGPDFFNLTADGYSDIFLAKYSNEGNLLGAVAFEATDDVFYLNDHLIDNQSNIYIVGSFSGTIILGQETNQIQLISHGLDDIFIAKFNNDLDLITAKNIGGISSEESYSLSFDNQDNIYLTGRYSGEVDFDFDSGLELLATTSIGEIFVAKYNSELDFQNVISLESSYAFNSGLSMDINNNSIYITGIFSEPVDFDPGEVEYLLTPASNASDVFLAEYDHNLNFKSVINIGGIDFDYGYSCAVSLEGEVYMTGSFNNNVDFDPSEEEAILHSTGNEDFFLAKYTTSPTGTFQPADTHSPSTLFIHPNPTSETITLQAGVVFQQASVYVYDMLGRILLFEKGINGETFQLNLKGFSDGMYLIEVREDNRVWNGKAVIKN